MRRFLLPTVLLGLATPTFAQTTVPAESQNPVVRECRPFDAPPLVTVTLRDGRKLRATLTCLGEDAELVSNGKVTHAPLASIAKIAEPRDPVWDGPVIGAAIGALMWAICGNGCDNGYMARATVDYALLGLVIDSATSHNKTIYQASRAPTLSVRVRF